jgi:16S rRNA processing protein RimM
VATPAAERITVGLVRGLHGLRGAVRVEVLSDDPERFAVGSVLFADGDDEPLTVTWAGESKPGILVAFEGFYSRESADRLRDRYLEAIASTPLPEGSWYWHQIRGLEVRTAEGEVLGNVTDVFRAGEGEVYIVRGGTRGEVLVPSVKGIIVELDPESGHLVVDAVALALPDKPPRRRRRHELTRADRKERRQRRAPRSTKAPKTTS